ncbi:MAG: CPBP family glutamic-type intramembrane protease [Bryobacteraceae bacterium]|jgi:hypothetical protein
MRFRFTRLSVIVLLIYVLPTALICSGVIPFAYRYHVLLLMAAAAGIVSWRAGHTSALHGLRLDNLRASLRLNAFFLVLAAVGVAAMLLLSSAHHSLNSPGVAFGLFYVLISCPAQEFLFRSYPWAELRSAGCSSPVLEFALLVIPYTLVHLVYRDLTTLALTFAAGAGWYFIYRRAPNLWGVSLAHSAAGLATIVCGLI